MPARPLTGDALTAFVAAAHQRIHEDVEQALGVLEEQKKTDAEQRIVRKLEEIENLKADGLSNLRFTRGKEKLQKAYLRQLTEAAAIFFKDANEQAFNKTSNKLRNHLDNEIDRLAGIQQQRRNR